jgi:gas vesicle protein
MLWELWIMNERSDYETIKKIFALMPNELKQEIEEVSKKKRTEVLEYCKQALTKGMLVKKRETLKEKNELISEKIAEFEKQIKSLKSENDTLLNKIREVEEDNTWLINRTEELERINEVLVKKLKLRGV